MKAKTAHYTEIEPTRFDGGPAKGVDGRVLIGKADGAQNFCMRLFVVDPGGHTPKHSHGWEHEIFIHAGEGHMLLGGETRPVSAGAAVFIPPGMEHQIQNTGRQPLMVVCLVPAAAPEL
ncbi:MAG: cupin domain-containing protein [Deltaproteobacteria bacterium]|nr:cupin domain-containing protein [Deltaproteobacteria bacterium]